MKSRAPLLSIDIMYMIDLDVNYFSVVCLSIYYEKPAVKTKITTMGHFFAKKLNQCPSDIICNSIKMPLLETHFKHFSLCFFVYHTNPDEE